MRYKATGGGNGDDAPPVVKCPGCGVQLAPERGARDPTPGSSAECLSRYDELAGYTLGHGDPFFLHQLIVDAYAAQHACSISKPITTAFALVGLHLFVACGFTGRQVQLAHMQLARRPRTWPKFSAPAERGAFNVMDALAAPPGRSRDDEILAWARSIWSAWSAAHEAVRELAGRLDTRRNLSGRDRSGAAAHL